jgi:nucleoid-associated protein YgaU
MALLDFIKEAGEKLFHLDNKPASTPARQTPQSANTASEQSAADPTATVNAAAGDAILNYIKSQKLDATGLTVTYDSATSTATVFGVAPDQTTKEKIILCCGNVANVSHVNDRMSVDQSGSQSKFYTVKSGDTLSKIARESYGDANEYTKIFEANRPMLKSPDKIYPGQTLRIPQD